MALNPSFKATIKQLMPIFVCMILLVLITSLTGCEAGANNYQTVNNSASAFMRNCDFPSMRYQVTQQNDMQTFIITCKQSHDTVH
jgi:hypothetical protein